MWLTPNNILVYLWQYSRVRWLFAFLFMLVCVCIGRDGGGAAPHNLPLWILCLVFSSASWHQPVCVCVCMCVCVCVCACMCAQSMLRTRHYVVYQATHVSCSLQATSFVWFRKKLLKDIIIIGDLLPSQGSVAQQIVHLREQNACSQCNIPVTECRNQLSWDAVCVQMECTSSLLWQPFARELGATTISQARVLFIVPSLGCFACRQAVSWGGVISLPHFEV